MAGQRDIAILGAGTAGRAAAIRADRDGVRVKQPDRLDGTLRLTCGNTAPGARRAQRAHGIACSDSGHHTGCIRPGKRNAHGQVRSRARGMLVSTCTTDPVIGGPGRFAVLPDARPRTQAIARPDPGMPVGRPASPAIAGGPSC